jgi:hypothetical protein
MKGALLDAVNQHNTSTQVENEIESFAVNIMNRIANMMILVGVVIGGIGLLSHRFS